MKTRELHDDSYVTPFTLKTKRGWTDAAIDRFLSEADQSLEAEHPYKKGAKMTIRLYALQRVILVENTEEFRCWLERRAATSTGRAAAAAKRRAAAGARYRALNQ